MCLKVNIRIFKSYQVRILLATILEGNKLVGYDISGDLKSIGIEDVTTDDLAEYFKEYIPPVKYGCRSSYTTYSLKDVAAHFFSDKGFQCSIHSALTDARMTRDLWIKKNECLEKYPSAKVFYDKINRSVKPKYQFVPEDICKCNGSEKKRKGPYHFYPPY